MKTIEGRVQLHRRALLQRAAALAAVAIGGAACSPVSSRPKFTSYPFTLGVASGDPVTDGFVIWTRLAPDPFDRASIADDTVPVIWDVAADEGFQSVLRSGTALARRALAHSVHVEVRGLAPQRPYWYRFRIPGGDASAIGRAWSAPLPGTPLDRFKFAFASCQHYEQGYFTAYRDMIAQGPELIVHLGDYIYESSWGEQVRRHEGPEPATLDEYRDRHALYKTEPNLQAAHAHCPWLVTWDDHEVDNDYQGVATEDWQDEAAFVKRRAAAYQAYYEHMPLRHVAVPRANEMRLYQRSTFGDLIEFSVLDNRQYRSPAACRTKERGGANPLTDECKELFDPNRTFLGKDQERWLADGLRRASAKWNVIAQQQMFSRLRQKNAEGREVWWSEDWNGFIPARDRVLDAIEKSKLSNPVVLTGDIHSYWINDVKRDVKDDKSPVLATELVGTSITSRGVPYEQFAQFLPDNPHVKFFESRKRGYMLCEVAPRALTTTLRIVEDVRDPGTKPATLAKFVIEDGKPGAVRDGVPAATPAGVPG